MSHEDPHSKAADAVHEGRPVEAQYTKQGKGGRRVSVEMGVAIALTLVGFVVVYLLFSGSFRKADAVTGDQADAAAFATTVPTPDAPTTATGQPSASSPDGTPNVNAPGQ